MKRKLPDGGGDAEDETRQVSQPRVAPRHVPQADHQSLPIKSVERKTVIKVTESAHPTTSPTTSTIKSNKASGGRKGVEDRQKGKQKASPL